MKIFKSIVIVILVVFVSINVYASSLFNKGLDALKLGYYDKAYYYFFKDYTIHPTPKLAYYIGISLEKMGQDELAIKYFKKASSKISDAYSHIVKIYIGIGKFKDAETFLNYIENKEEYFFYSGLLSLYKKNFKTALNFFLKSATYKGTLEQKSLFYSALIELKLSNKEKSKEYFKEVIKVNSNTVYAKKAKVYLRAIKKQEKPYTVFLSAGYQYNSNVVAKPSNKIGDSDIDNISKKGDSAFVGKVFASYKLMMDSIELKSSVFIYRISYADLKDYNSTYIKIAEDIGLNKKRYKLATELFYEKSWLGGDSYLEGFGMKPYAIYYPYKKLAITAGVKLEKVNFFKNASVEAENRDAKIIKPFINLYRAVNRLFFFGNANFSYNNAKGRNWDYNEIALGGGVGYNFSSRFTASAGANYSYRGFLHNNSYSGAGYAGFPSTPSKRKDKNSTFWLRATVKLNDYIRLTCSFTHYYQNSNFDIYKYKQNIFYSGLSVLF
ncbi:surface lipoprotein assembly modifier [Hippea jasoniae]|uniref:surface lipoprotein assembly modifier n=1 Tax=Hippea jasoniae TaxID=944479 RepID=UPI0005551157|nr:surface lipoprotein assembly modifier [Hippea jasoniae]